MEYLHAQSRPPAGFTIWQYVQQIWPRSQQHRPPWFMCSIATITHHILRNNCTGVKFSNRRQLHRWFRPSMTHWKWIKGMYHNSHSTHTYLSHTLCIREDEAHARVHDGYKHLTFIMLVHLYARDEYSRTLFRKFRRIVQWLRNCCLNDKNKYYTIYEELYITMKTCFCIPKPLSVHSTRVACANFRKQSFSNWRKFAVNKTVWVHTSLTNESISFRQLQTDIPTTD